ncbi:MAG: hypothetical protein ABI460_06105 [Caldimonas sp.]
MADFDSSTLWRISAFERARDAGQLTAGGEDRPTLLPTTLMVDLQQLQKDPVQGDILEVIAACVRNREAALLYLKHGSHVWPVTLFPREFLYHSPRDVANMTENAGMSGLRLISAEPPGVKPPGDAMSERIAGSERYHPLGPLLWSAALHGPRASLLMEISGRVAYRLVSSSARDLPPSLGALSSATVRLKNETASLKDISQWPGLSVERASRLLNALYLTGALMVSRSHPAARSEPMGWRSWFGRRK